MKILQVHTRYRQRGGEDAVVESEAALLREGGHTVVQHIPANPQGPVAASVALLRAPWNQQAAREAARVVAAERPDVAHIHNTWFAQSPSVVEAIDEAGVPVVMTLHNYRLLCSNALLYRDGHPCEDCVGSHPWHGVIHRCYRGSAAASLPAAATIAVARRRGTWHRHVARFLALNHFARDRFIAAGMPGDKIAVKPNFTEDPGPRPAPPSRSSAVLYVGRLSQEKGVTTLLAAWAAARPAGLELVVYGDGPLRPSLERHAPRDVRFMGTRPPEEVRAAMLAARALLFPSQWYEGQPMTVLEAMSCGLPVAASSIGGMPELLAGLGPHWLAPSGDATGWQNLVTRLAPPGGDQLVDSGGTAARAAYEADFAREQALPRLVEAYRAVRYG